MLWHAQVITLMPDMYPGPLGHSLIGESHANGAWALNVMNLHDYGVGKHNNVDDTPYGGGAGMVIRPDAMDAAIMAAKAAQPESQLIYLTPRGEPLKQAHFSEFTPKPITFICGRYEAVDERVIAKHAPREISLGDFVLTGGDIAAMAIIDGCVRLLPNVIGDAQSLREESFGLDETYANLLEYPHYTKPAEWENIPVPEVLLGGHHAKIDAWRREAAEALTAARRPDMWEQYQKTLKNPQKKA